MFSLIVFRKISKICTYLFLDFGTHNSQMVSRGISGFKLHSRNPILSILQGNKQLVSRSVVQKQGRCFGKYSSIFSDNFIGKSNQQLTILCSSSTHLQKKIEKVRSTVSHKYFLTRNWLMRNQHCSTFWIALRSSVHSDRSMFDQLFQGGPKSSQRGLKLQSSPSEGFVIYSKLISRDI